MGKNTEWTPDDWYGMVWMVLAFAVLVVILVRGM